MASPHIAVHHGKQTMPNEDQRGSALNQRRHSTPILGVEPLLGLEQLQEIDIAQRRPSLPSFSLEQIDEDDSSVLSEVTLMTNSNQEEEGLSDKVLHGINQQTVILLNDVEREALLRQINQEQESKWKQEVKREKFRRNSATDRNKLFEQMQSLRLQDETDSDVNDEMMETRPRVWGSMRQERRSSCLSASFSSFSSISTAKLGNNYRDIGEDRCQDKPKTLNLHNRFYAPRPKKRRTQRENLSTDPTSDDAKGDKIINEDEIMSKIKGICTIPSSS